MKGCLFRYLESKGGEASIFCVQEPHHFLLPGLFSIHIRYANNADALDCFCPSESRFLISISRSAAIFSLVSAIWSNSRNRAWNLSHANLEDLVEKEENFDKHTATTTSAPAQTHTYFFTSAVHTASISPSPNRAFPLTKPPQPPSGSTDSLSLTLSKRFRVQTK